MTTLYLVTIRFATLRATLDAMRNGAAFSKVKQ